MFRLAWRNVWRNQRRSLITISALAIGIFAIVFIGSLQHAVYGTVIRTLTTGLVGHLQVHGAGWQQAPELAKFVPDPALVEAAIRDRFPGASSVKRVMGSGLAGSEEASTGAVILGLEPASERGPGRILTVKQGRDLADLPAKEAILGLELAQELGVIVGGEVVLVGEAVDGSVANDRYRIVGLADAGSGELNSTAVFLHLADAQEFFALGQGVHQIIVHLPTDREDVMPEVLALRGALDVAQLEAVGWNEIVPEFKGTADAKRNSTGAVSFLVFIIVALGVLNAMTMSTFERTRELGVLASLGTRRGRLLGMILAESLIQGLLGLAIGAGLALVLMKGLGQITMPGVGGQDMIGVRLPDSIELQLQWVVLRNAAITAISTGLVGGFFPAWKASRMRPVEATRYA